MKTLLLLGLVLAAPLGAAPKTDLMRQYIYLKDDADRFVGEGVAELKDHGGSLPQALEAARLRAKAALAESVRARISSSTVEQSSVQDGQAHESLSSTASSQADVALEAVALKELVDFPEAGQVTVLASVAKEDYRRQLAGKGPRVYRPEWGMRAGVVSSTYFELMDLVDGEHKKFNGGIALAPGSGTVDNSAQVDGLLGFGLEFRFRDWSLELDQALKNEISVYAYDPVTATYTPESHKIEILGLEAGYDWTPLAWRVQPFFPVRLRAHSLHYGDYAAWDYAASLGVGLRYWPNDSVAFEASGRTMLGLNHGELLADGKPLLLGPGRTAAPSLTGAQWQFSLMWSGF